MYIFGKKRIAELEKELAEVKKTLNNVENERDRYVNDVAELTTKFEVMAELQDAEPVGCVRGPWCKACEFAKEFQHIEHYGFCNYKINTAYMCSKGKSCQYFVQKEVSD